MLACPSCRRLVFAGTMKSLAQRAEATESVGNFAESQFLWRQVLTLLPPNAPQRAGIDANLARLHERISGTETTAGKHAASPRLAKWLGAAAPAVAFVLAKWKLILIGLTKLPTLLSMGAALAVYWSVWGWRFALGFLVSVYIHEMGHVFALRYYKIPASVPLFLPGFGAVVFSYPIKSPAQDSRVGLSGPLAGLLPVLAFWLVGLLSGNKLPLGIAYFGALVNFINLLPVWSLDGARGLRGLSGKLRWWLAGWCLAAAWILNSLAPFALGCVIAVCILITKGEEEVKDPDWVAFGLFAFLILSLSWMVGMQVPLPNAANGS
jgi:Zn-dependent protease